MQVYMHLRKRYHNDISVTVHFPDDRVVVKNHSKLNVFNSSLATKIACTITCLCLLWRPLMFCLKDKHKYVGCKLSQLDICTVSASFCCCPSSSNYVAVFNMMILYMLDVCRAFQSHFRMRVTEEEYLEKNLNYAIFHT